MRFLLFLACTAAPTEPTAPPDADADTDTDTDTDSDADTDTDTTSPPLEPLACGEDAGCADAVDRGDGFFECGDHALNRGCVRTYANAVTSVPPDLSPDCGTSSIPIPLSSPPLCRQLCASDLDCALTEACVPYDDDYHICVPADCHTNADCATGECGLFPDVCYGVGFGRLACRAEQPECRRHNQCPPATPPAYAECNPTGGGTCSVDLCSF